MKAGIIAPMIDITIPSKNVMSKISPEIENDSFPAPSIFTHLLIDDAAIVCVPAPRTIPADPIAPIHKASNKTTNII